MGRRRILGVFCVACTTTTGRMSMSVEDRGKWTDDQVKEDHKMWTEIIGGGRVLTEEQQKRYDATRDEVAKRHIIPVSAQG